MRVDVRHRQAKWGLWSKWAPISEWVPGINMFEELYEFASPPDEDGIFPPFRPKPGIGVYDGIIFEWGDLQFRVVHKDGRLIDASSLVEHAKGKGVIMARGPVDCYPEIGDAPEPESETIIYTPLIRQAVQSVSQLRPGRTRMSGTKNCASANSPMGVTSNESLPATANPAYHLPQVRRAPHHHRQRARL